MGYHPIILPIFKGIFEGSGTLPEEGLFHIGTEWGDQGATAALDQLHPCKTGSVGQPSK